MSKRWYVLVVIIACGIIALVSVFAKKPQNLISNEHKQEKENGMTDNTTDDLTVHHVQKSSEKTAETESGSFTNRADSYSDFRDSEFMSESENTTDLDVNQETVIYIDENQAVGGM